MTRRPPRSTLFPYTPLSRSFAAPPGVAVTPEPKEEPMARHTVRDPLSLLHLRTKKHYGWNHDIPDERDHIYSAPLDRYAQGVPPKVDLRQYCPPVYDQGEIGAFATDSAPARPRRH